MRLNNKYYFGFMMFITMVLSACGDSNSSNSSGDGLKNLFAENNNCLASTGKQEVLDIMLDWYLWNDEVEQAAKYENLDIDKFSDVDAMLDFLRYRPAEFDKNFTFVTTSADENVFFNEGEFIGFGFSITRIGNTDELRITKIFENSPADQAGLERGFRLLEVNGQTIAQIDQVGGDFFGAVEVGVSRSLLFEDRAGQVLPLVTLAKAVVTIDPVPLVQILRDSNNDIIAGYIVLDTFINTANNQLRDAFVQLNNEGIDKVIVDLRYNGGGLINVAEVFGSLLAGPDNQGEVFFHNKLNSLRAPEFNSTSHFMAEANAINLEGLVFIVSNHSASASELLINSLRPYFDDEAKPFALVGSTTFGKPVGQYGFDFCNAENRLRAVTFRAVNKNEEGNYFNGLTVDCSAGDELLESLGDQNEDSLSKAIHYIQNGACPVSIAPTRLKTAQAKPVQQRMLSGPTVWQQNAYAF